MSFEILEISINSPCSASIIIQYGIKSWPIWECDPSSFPWQYEEKETCLILEGDATITTEDGEVYKIKSGDLVKFPAGLKCSWVIHKAIKKHYRFGD